MNTHTKRPKAVPVMQNYLRFPIMGAPAQWSEAQWGSADYRQWAWHVHHAQALRGCAVSSVVVMFLYLRAIKDTLLKLQICSVILLAAIMAVLTVNRLPLAGLAAANWALGDTRIKSWLVFLCMHIAAGVPFYVSVQGYSLPLAIFKVALIQGLSLITYTAIKHPICKTYIFRFADTSKHGSQELQMTHWAQNKQEQEYQTSKGHRRLAMWAAGDSTSTEPPPLRSQSKMWGGGPDPQAPSTLSSSSLSKAATEQHAVGPAHLQGGHGDVPEVQQDGLGEGQGDVPECHVGGVPDLQESRLGGSADLQEGHGDVPEGITDQASRVGHSRVGHSHVGHSRVGHSRAGHSCVGHSHVGNSRVGHSLVGHSREALRHREGHHGGMQHMGACAEPAAAEARLLPTGFVAESLLPKGPADLAQHAAKGPVDLAQHAAKGPVDLAQHAAKGPVDLAQHAAKGPADLAHHAAKGPVDLAQHAAKGPVDLAQHAAKGPVDLAQHAAKGPVDLAQHAAKGPVDLAQCTIRMPGEWSADKRHYISNLRRSTVSIKLCSSFGPEKLSQGAPSRLIQRMTSSFPGVLVMDVAVRHGCIMLSMDMCELQRIAQQRGEGQADGLSQDKIMQEIIRQWLLNSGLQDLLEDGTALAVQVDGSVLECTWNSEAQAWELSTEPMPLNRDLFSIMVPDFVLLFPSQTSHLEDHHLQQQQQQQLQLTFKAYISAPSQFRLIGWHANMAGQTHGREQGEDTLQLLAHSQGRFLAIEVLHLGNRDENGGQSVLACVSLTPDMMACECCQLRLDLMRDNALLCNHNTLLMRSDLHPEVQDVKDWAKPPRTPAQISEFIEDLAQYLSFQSLVRYARNHPPALLDSVHKNLGCNAGGVWNWDSLLPVLLAETCRPEMLQMMAEVGMDLLQHAVSWGMVHLAERILSGMLASPLNIPFATIASCALSADCDVDRPPAQQSLLFYALQSEDVVIFKRVLEWGHLYGGPTFTWDSDGSGIGSDPQLARMVQGLPPPHGPLTHSHAAALQQLLGGGAPAAAEVQRTWGAKHSDAGALQLPLRQRQLSGSQTVGSPSSVSASAAATVTPCSVAASVTAPKSVAAQSGINSSSSLSTPSTPSSKQALLPPSSHGNALVTVARALAMGFGEHGDIKESQYRAWCEACCVGLANKVCIGVVPFFWFQAALSLGRGLYKSAFTLALYPVPMFLAFISKNSEKRQACMFWAKILHLCYYIIFGLGLMPTTVARKLAITHLDLIVEVVLCRLLWQVQLRALLVERVASTIGSSMLYSRLQFQHPLLQALAINFASVCVGIALDMRNRRMYVHLVRAGALLSQRGKKVQ